MKQYVMAFICPTDELSWHSRVTDEFELYWILNINELNSGWVLKSNSSIGQ